MVFRDDRRRPRRRRRRGHPGGGGGVPDLHGGAVGRQRHPHQAGVLVQGRAGAGAQGLRRQVVQHQGHQDLRGVQAGRAEPPRHPAACAEHSAARPDESRRREHGQIRSVQVS